MSPVELSILLFYFYFYFFLGDIFPQRYFLGDTSIEGITCHQHRMKMYINSVSSASFIIYYQNTTHHNMKSLISFSVLLAAIATVAQGNTSCPF